MWIVMVIANGGLKAHSPHNSEQTAIEWAKCLEYGGMDASVCVVPADVCEDIVTLLEEETT